MKVAILAILLSWVATTSAWASPPTVAVDLSTLEASAYTQLDGVALEKRIVLRLVQDGFAVVAVTAKPDVLVLMRKTAIGLLVEARGPSGAKQLNVRFSDIPQGRVQELHLEVAQKTSQLVGLVAVTPPVRLAPWRWAAGVRLQWLLRPSGTGWATEDVGPGAWLQNRVASRVLVRLEAGMMLTGSHAITVTEYALLVGPLYALPLTARLEARLGAMVGLGPVSYASADPSNDIKAGNRFDLLAHVPLELALQVFARWELALRGEVGVASRGRTHVSSTSAEPVWQRGAMRTAATLAVGYTW